MRRDSAQILRRAARARPMQGVRQQRDRGIVHLLDHSQPGGGTYNQVRRISKVEMSIAMHDLSPDNFARALFGAANTVAASTVTDEEVTAYVDAFIPFAKIPSGSIVVTHTSGTPTYTANTDYVVRPGGIFIPATGSAITDGQSIKVDYAYAAQNRGVKFHSAVHLVQVGEVSGENIGLVLFLDAGRALAACGAFRLGPYTLNRADRRAGDEAGRLAYGITNSVTHLPGTGRAADAADNHSGLGHKARGGEGATDKIERAVRGDRAEHRSEARAGQSADDGAAEHAGVKSTSYSGQSSSTAYDGSGGIAPSDARADRGLTNTRLEAVLRSRGRRGVATRLGSLIFVQSGDRGLEIVH